MKILLILSTLFLAGCAEDKAEPEEDRQRGMIEQAVDSQKEALDKAKAVEAQMMEAVEQQKKEIDEQSQ